MKTLITIFVSLRFVQSAKATNLIYIEKHEPIGSNTKQSFCPFYVRRIKFLEITTRFHSYIKKG